MTELFYFPKRKKKTIRRFCKILSTDSFVPERVIENEEIINNYHPFFKNEVIIKTIGVERRHIAEKDEDDSDILLKSAKGCLDNYGILPDNLSRILVNKFMGDNLLPMTASRLQGKLGCKTAVHAFDIDGGTSAFIHSMDAASRFINSGDEYILISSGGINSKFVSKTDPRVAFLYGDASASILLGYSEEKHMLASYFYSNYQYYDMSVMLSPITLSDKFSGTELLSVIDDFYKMENWKAAESFYREAVREVSRNILEESGLEMKDIDLVLVTENNAKIWELTLETLGVYAEKSISLIREYGNTMTAMLPLLIDHGFTSGKIQQGMNIMLISHGEGFSGGGLIYRV
ncbi:3-oxoacyl-ACP synthase III family protein [Acetivibrio mesophilus]|uniref:Ketoacyl-ACP synthase III n=1 Tax=Acetivibrio mesophilus TaxID=2487273 RepID=A0A4V1K262_9FIRM|nr:3-oxoacyl-[acyl-carrier-protein] synthase III C-terminal domain-containing protein [Acetivibrio mesophilus]RXE59179.1 ketoacyl-ACP synthase III [Acetivibrio mesophilus]